MTTQLLSLCCGALPLGGVINERFSHSTGHCGFCHSHTTFGPGGVLEGQPRFLTLPPLKDLGGIEPQPSKQEEELTAHCTNCNREYVVLRNVVYNGLCFDCWDHEGVSRSLLKKRTFWRGLWQDLVAVSSWAFLVLLLIFMAARAEGCKSSRESGGQEQRSGTSTTKSTTINSSHAP